MRTTRNLEVEILEVLEIHRHHLKRKLHKKITTCAKKSLRGQGFCRVSKGGHEESARDCAKNMWKAARGRKSANGKTKGNKVGTARCRHVLASFAGYYTSRVRNVRTPDDPGNSQSEPSIFRYGRLVLGCIDASDSGSRRIFSNCRHDSSHSFAPLQTQKFSRSSWKTYWYF